MYKTTIKVEGMMCGMCESHVNDSIRKAFTVKNVSSSHTKNETVIISEEIPDEEKIRNTITSQGYTVNGITSEIYQKKGLFSFFNRK